jgi:AraC family transcriptional regulator
MQAYINAHLDQNLTLDRLSQIAQLSAHHFATCFKQSIGQPPHQYITQCRIDQAKQLLKQSNLSIVEIAHRVSFQNQSHFTRIFRQYTQTTPKVYRSLLL